MGEDPGGFCWGGFPAFNEDKNPSIIVLVLYKHSMYAKGSMKGYACFPVDRHAASFDIPLREVENRTSPAMLQVWVQSLEICSLEMLLVLELVKSRDRRSLFVIGA